MRISKTFFIFAILFVLFIILAAIICSASNTDTITESEAKNLILEAFKFYYKYQFSEEEIKILKDDISAQAREIYTDDIADDMWMKRCYGSTTSKLYRDTKLALTDIQNCPQAYSDVKIATQYYQDIIDQMFGNDGKTFIDSHDGYVTILPYASSIMDWRRHVHEFWGIRANSSSDYWSFVISKEYSSDVCSEDIRPKNIEDIITNGITKDGNTYKTSVLIYQNMYLPVWSDVYFTKTSYGWKVCGGNIIFVLSDWSAVTSGSLKDDVSLENKSKWLDNTIKILDVPSISNHLCSSVAVPSACLAIRNWTPDAIDYVPVDVGGFKFLYQEGNKAYYLLEYIPSNIILDSQKSDYSKSFSPYVESGESKGYLTAEFTFDANYTYNNPYTNNDYVKGYWKLTGGEWYDLAVTNGYNPNTGDNDVIFYALIAAVSFFSTAIIYKRRINNANASFSIRNS